jgi:2-iminobutanoate/2-iminopropanoate deaminase
MACNVFRRCIFDLGIATLLGVATAGAGGALAAETAPRYIEQAPTGTGIAPPFSEAVIVGDTVYVAGHVGLDPKTQRAVADTDGEAHAVLDAVQETLKKAGLHMDDLVSVTVYCTDLGLYDAFNAAYRTYFHGHYPARAFIGVSSLVRGAHFEIAGVANRPRGK